ncbi:MAG TPA: histidine kinase, partial [Bryobacteraceae bacterium]|nr:histidine kinase [Bryobacteraceae bacterium]
MLLILVLAGIDAIRLVGQMRTEDKILRDASLERSHRLTTVRAYVLLSHAYAGDYFEMDRQESEKRLLQLRTAWSQMAAALADYRPYTVQETVLIKQLRQLLSEHWANLNSSMPPSAAGRPRGGKSYIQSQVDPLRSAVLEITTRVDNVDAMQLASTEAGIQSQFDNTARRLSVVLNIALGSALVLALGCILYILRIERQNRRNYQEILKGRKELEQLSERLVNAHEDERRSISRELHDEVGQTLNAVLVDAANLANHIPPENAAARRYLDSIRKLADSSVNSIRNIALLLRPSMLDDLGLIPALEWQAREVSRRSDIKVKVIAEDVPDALPDALRTSIYRVVQEALHNISRHSNASAATVSVRQNGSFLSLTVEDDGSGFDPK